MSMNKLSTMRPIMFVGTGSDVGKSVLAAGFCRILLQDGYHPAPFKAQNMSLNSYPTPEDGEIGRAQAVQAEACGIPCHTDMNPILLKPTADSTTQVILNGQSIGNQSAREYFNSSKRKPLFDAAMQSYHRLAKQYSPMVIEGAGSISEVNLWDFDIVNMRVALATGAATYLVADIQRGGVIASLYGTIMLLPPAERAAIKGIIINKFRGDSSLFDEGRKIVEELTGVPVVGVLPFLPNINIDEEDGMSIERYASRPVAGQINVGVVRTAHISNFTDFDVLASIPGVNLFFSRDKGDLSRADILCLPGSKNTIDDLLDLRSEGIDEVLLQHYHAGKPLYGICGGYQMMGEEIADPLGIEGNRDSVQGLGILPTKTILEERKTTTTGTFTYLPTGVHLCRGYEIHCGTTTCEQPAPLCMIGGQTPEGYRISDRVWGTYLHGILDNETVLRSILAQVAPGQHFDIPNSVAARELAYDRLADHMRQHLDMEYIYRSLTEI